MAINTARKPPLHPALKAALVERLENDAACEDILRAAQPYVEEAIAKALLAADKKALGPEPSRAMTEAAERAFDGRRQGRFAILWRAMWSAA